MRLRLCSILHLLRQFMLANVLLPAIIIGGIYTGAGDADIARCAGSEAMDMECCGGCANEEGKMPT